MGQKLSENIAAISAVFHQDERYEAFYKRQQNNLGGFPEIWKYCVEAAVSFTEVERRHRVRWDNADWVDAIDAFVDGLYTSEYSVALFTLATTAIKKTLATAKEAGRPYRG